MNNSLTSRRCCLRRCRLAVNAALSTITINDTKLSPVGWRPESNPDEHFDSPLSPLRNGVVVPQVRCTITYLQASDQKTPEIRTQCEAQCHPDEKRLSSPKNMTLPRVHVHRTYAARADCSYWTVIDSRALSADERHVGARCRSARRDPAGASDDRQHRGCGSGLGR